MRAGVRMHLILTTLSETITSSRTPAIDQLSALIFRNVQDNVHIDGLYCKTESFSKSPIMTSWRPSWNFYENEIMRKIVRETQMHLYIPLWSKYFYESWKFGVTPILHMAILTVVNFQYSNIQGKLEPIGKPHVSIIMASICIYILFLSRSDYF